jgi:hypothetical protein
MLGFQKETYDFKRQNLTKKLLSYEDIQSKKMLDTPTRTLYIFSPTATLFIFV